MTKSEAKWTQSFILKLMGDHLDQMAVHELKIKEANSETSKSLWSYYKIWNRDLEKMYKANSLYIKNEEFDKVEGPQRQEPPRF